MTDEPLPLTRVGLFLALEAAYDAVIDCPHTGDDDADRTALRRRFARLAALTSEIDRRYGPDLANDILWTHDGHVMLPVRAAGNPQYAGFARLVEASDLDERDERDAESKGGS